MYPTDVHCIHNNNSITVEANHIEAGLVRFTIGPNQALIDDQGCIRYFTLEYEDGDAQGYKLHPKYSVTQRGIIWAADFLDGYGLSRLGSAIMTKRNERVNLARYMIFSNPGGQIIRSFVKNLFPDGHLAYHNIATDKLIFTEPLYVR